MLPQQQEINKNEENKKSEFIRNVTILAPIDHGRSTLIDNLKITSSGILQNQQINNENEHEEAEMKYFSRKTGNSYHYNYLTNENDIDSSLNNNLNGQYIINLINCGNFGSTFNEEDSNFKLSDGAIILIDCVEGLNLQHELMIRNCLFEKIKPIFFINKIDRLILELNMLQEEIYQILFKIIVKINIFIETYNDETVFKDFKISPELDNVIFGSVLYNFGFTLKSFTKLYAKKFGLDEEKIKKKFWGNYTFDAKNKKWTKMNLVVEGNNNNNNNNNEKRCFCQFILDPMIKVIQYCFDDANRETHLYKTLPHLGISLTNTERLLNGKQLLKLIMLKWLPFGDLLFEMIIKQLPSPIKAQSYRFDHLYTGPLNDKYAESIKLCDENGPLMIYLTKVVPCTGMPVRVLNNDIFRMGLKKGIFETTFRQLLTFCDNNNNDEIETSSLCGNIIGFIGVDKNIVNGNISSGTATITNVIEKEAYPFITTRRAIASMDGKIRVAIEPVNSNDLPKVMNALDHFSRFGDYMDVSVDPETGQKIISSTSELQLNLWIQELKDHYLKGIEIKVSDPIIDFRETIIENNILQSSSNLYFSKNNGFKLFIESEPLPEDLINEIESGKINIARKDLNYLRNNYDGWKDESLKILTFGSDNAVGNILVGPSNLIKINDDYNTNYPLNCLIEDCINVGFQQATLKGILCDEPVRGLKSKVTFIPEKDFTKINNEKLIEISKKAFHQSQLICQPRLMEPMYLAEISCPQSVVGKVYTCINMCRGMFEQEEKVMNTTLFKVKAFIPALESGKFTTMMRSESGGQAFVQFNFNHWELIEDDPFDKNCHRVRDIIKSVRKRKGLKEELPEISDFEK
ncbi:hypothetical protein ABK040_002547 [Willaertia magna]